MGTDLLDNAPQKAANPRAPGTGRDGAVRILEVLVQGVLLRRLGIRRRGLVPEGLLLDVVVGEIHPPIRAQRQLKEACVALSEQARLSDGDDTDAVWGGICARSER